MSDVAALVITYDHCLQLVLLVCSVIGIALSCQLVRDAWRDWQVARHEGVVTQLIGRAHLRSQVVVLLMQLGFGLITSAVLVLPEVPAQMGGADHTQIMLTIVGRKLVRAGMILLLMVAAVQQSRDRRVVFALLTNATNGGFR